MVSGDAYMGMFRRRAMLYGENFWEILIIPLRFFFQGRDYSDQYFDGVLNPLLIIMVPFAFMNKSFQKDKIFFVVFSVFFILITFFLDELRIRYILPTIPFLSILTVMGIMNILNRSPESLPAPPESLPASPESLPASPESLPASKDKTSPLMRFFTGIVLILLITFGAKNALYLKNYFQKLQPINYICNMETKDDYLNRHLKSYAAISYINKYTPRDARIRLIFLAGRGYYLDRVYEDDSSFGMNVIRDLVANSNYEITFQKYLHSLGCTHLLVRRDLLLKYLYDNYSPEKTDRLFRQMKKAAEIIYEANGYVVYKLIPSLN